MKNKWLWFGVLAFGVIGIIISLWLPWVEIGRRNSFEVFRLIREFDEYAQISRLKPFLFLWYLAPFALIAGMCMLLADKRKLGIGIVLFASLFISITALYISIKMGMFPGEGLSIGATMIVGVGIVGLLKCDPKKADS